MTYDPFKKDEPKEDWFLSLVPAVFGTIGGCAILYAIVAAIKSC